MLIRHRPKDVLWLPRFGDWDRAAVSALRRFPGEEMPGVRLLGLHRVRGRPSVSRSGRDTSSPTGKVRGLPRAHARPSSRRGPCSGFRPSGRVQWCPVGLTWASPLTWDVEHLFGPYLLSAGLLWEAACEVLTHFYIRLLVLVFCIFEF